jgi:molybdopterin-binding protein
MLESRGLALSSELVEQSIRNEPPGTVKSIVSDKVLSEVIVETSIGEVASVLPFHQIRVE